MSKITFEEALAIATEAIKKYVDENSNGGGNGESGATFTPSVSSDGILSWSNDKELENPASVNIKGPKGDKGDTGATAAQVIAALEKETWTFSLEDGSTVTKEVPLV